jgi:putative transposase
MELPDRKSRRLHSHDYSRTGVYFVTVYAFQGREHFGGIAEGSIALNAAGHASDSIWKALPQRYPALRLDAFVVMPNHVHGIFFPER